MHVPKVHRHILHRTHTRPGDPEMLSDRMLRRAQDSVLLGPWAPGLLVVLEKLVPPSCRTRLVVLDSSHAYWRCRAPFVGLGFSRVRFVS